MSASFQDIVNSLSCPDDGSSLAPEMGSLVCRRCARRFPTHGGNVLEILPSHPTLLPEGVVSHRYAQGYLSEFRRPLSLEPAARAWGASEVVPARWARIRERQARQILPFLLDGQSASAFVLCDLSAGAAYYTFAYARLFRLVLHCDLSADSLSYARLKAQERGISNILFVRADYFSPPFRGSVDRLICFDTLIRGELHEQLLLQAIGQTLAPDGRAVVDFHNWWHDPLRRIGLLPQNFGHNRSYTRSEAERLLRDTGIFEFQYFPFIQEFDLKGATSKIAAKIIPGTRLVYRFSIPERSEDGSANVQLHPDGARQQ